MLSPASQSFPRAVRGELLAYYDFHNTQPDSTPQSETVRSADGNNVTTYEIGPTSAEHLAALATSYSGRAVYYNRDGVYMREDQHETITPEPAERLGIFAAIDPTELALYSTFEIVRSWVYSTELKRRTLSRFVGATLLGKTDQHAEGKKLLVLPTNRLSKEEQISFRNSGPENRAGDDPITESERRKAARSLLSDAREQIDRGHVVNIFTALRWRIHDERLLVPEVPDDPTGRGNIIP